MPRASTRAAVSLALAVTAVVLLLASLGLGWWQSQTVVDPWTLGGHEYRFQALTTYLPGSEYRVECDTNDSSMPGWGYICSAAGSNGFLNPYSSTIEPSPSLAATYASLEALILFTIVLAGLGAGLLCVAWLTGQSRRASRFGWFILLAAAFLALATPLWLSLEQPAAIGRDGLSTSSVPGGSGTAGSFWGSCSPSGPPCPGSNTTMSWGAGVGWYLSLVASTSLFASALAIRRRRTEDGSHRRS